MLETVRTVENSLGSAEESKRNPRRFTQTRRGPIGMARRWDQVRVRTKQKHSAYLPLHASRVVVPADIFVLGNQALMPDAWPRAATHAAEC